MNRVLGNAGVSTGASSGLPSAIAAERDRWVLWLPVALGLGIAGYFSLPHEPHTLACCGVPGTARRGVRSQAPTLGSGPDRARCPGRGILSRPDPDGRGGGTGARTSHGTGNGEWDHRNRFAEPARYMADNDLPGADFGSSARTNPPAHSHRRSFRRRRASAGSNSLGSRNSSASARASHPGRVRFRPTGLVPAVGGGWLRRIAPDDRAGPAIRPVRAPASIFCAKGSFNGSQTFCRARRAPSLPR